MDLFFQSFFFRIWHKWQRANTIMNCASQWPKLWTFFNLSHMCFVISNVSKVHVNLHLCYIDLICYPEIILDLFAKSQMSSGPHGPIFCNTCYYEGIKWNYNSSYYLCWQLNIRTLKWTMVSHCFPRNNYILCVKSVH